MAMAITGTFSGNILSLIGDNLDNTLTVSRNAAGTILANGGAINIVGGPATVANTSLIQMFGQGGNDVITMNEVNGALPAANIFGGAGNDTIAGGSGNDLLFGQTGNDVLLGKGGNDFLFGGTENDTLTGGDGDDQMFGEAGDDRMIWNPGDDSDLMEGGAGTDTAEVNGGNGAEVFTATANGTRVRFDRLDPAPFAIDIGTTERLVVNMNGGDDKFSATGNLAALIGVTVDGGTGNDTILGSNGADLLIGGDGNDFIDGQQGTDTILMGAGDDVFQWDPGDGSDTVEGGTGTDTMLFNGSAGNETMNLAANGVRTRFTRDLANIVMDLNDVERIDINALGGTDNIAVADMNGTDVRQVNISLAGTIGGTAGDGAADTVSVNSTNGNDTLQVTGSGSSFAVAGLRAGVSVTGSEGANDRLIVNAHGGNDTLTATLLPAGVVKLTLDGGAGNDRINGSQGADVLIGGDGNDTVTGDNGDDQILLGAGDDTAIWSPGDGNDTIEGGAGADKLVFNGANVAENIDLVANGGRALFLRNVANVTMDMDDVEQVDFNALGGADNVVVGDMTGTDVTLVRVNLAGTPGGTTGDGVIDTVTVNGSATAGDKIAITTSGPTATITGLAAKTIIMAHEVDDVIVVNGLGGDDVIDGSNSSFALRINGGLGKDVMTGGAGNDLITGGDGDDVALMGAGNDTFVWNPGDDNDVVEGGAGTDTLLFNGANIGETINISANGARTTFSRDVANVTMGLNDVETIRFNALGGADTIRVHDLSGTDVKNVAIDLAGSIGGTTGDGAVDTIIIDGTAGDDTIVIKNVNGVVTISGLGQDITITNFDAKDRIVINGLAGNDVIDASGLSVMSLIANAGDGDDVVIGGAANDLLSGDAGDDVLIGGPGIDTLDGGIGSNILIQ